MYAWKFWNRLKVHSLFRSSLFTSIFLIYSFIVSLFSCLFFWLWLSCDCCSPDYWTLVLPAGESGRSQLLLLLEDLCGLAPALLFPSPLCLSHNELLHYILSDGSSSLPFQGLCPCCSLCLEYFIQDSLQPGFTWFTTETLAPAQTYFSQGNSSRPSGYIKFF